MSVNFAENARRYGSFFETVREDRIEDILPLVTDDVRFKDPFNDVRGKHDLLRLLVKMFEDASEISFTMQEQAGEGRVYFLRWVFACRPNSRFVNDHWRFDGVSKISFDERGQVAEHVDYWDAAEQVYGRLPLIGGLLKILRRPLVLRG